MANNQNLEKRKSFTKNDPRINKAGRPKLPNLNILLANVLGEERDGKTAAEAILMALRTKAKKGDIRAAEVLLNRGYGSPKQQTEINLQGGIKLNFKQSDKCEPLGD